MRNSFLIFCVLFANFLFSQCSLEISDIKHIDCYGDNSGALAIDVVNAVKPYSLNLSNGAISINGNSFSGLVAGNYEIILTDANLCTDSVEVKLKEPSLLTLNLMCVENYLSAIVKGGVQPYSYFWRDESSFIFSNDSLVEFIPDQIFDFEVLDHKGCQLTDSVFLNIDFSVNTTIGDVPLSIEILNNSSEGMYYWDFGDENTSNDVNPTHEYESVGSYSLSLQLIDDHLCEDKKNMNIEVQGFNLSINNWEQMFNGFSPNGDGINDSFSFEDNNAISNFKVKIFNRWGNLVYSWTDPNFNWYGLGFNGDNLTEGVYYYIMNAEGIDGKLYEKKGSINLFF